MRRLLSLAVLLLLPAIILNAQKTGNKYWSSGKLTWEDYTKSSSLADDGSASSNSFGWETKDTTENFGNLTVHRVTSRVYLNKAQSWVNLSFATPEQLRYNQLFFDLNELECRKMLREIYDPETSFEVGFVQDYYIGVTAAKMSEINLMSDHGNDSSTLSYFDTIIQSQLATLPRGRFNPSSLKKGKHGFGARGGMGMEFFLGEPGEYLNTMSMMDFGLRYYYSRFFVDANFGMGALRSKQPFNVGNVNVAGKTGLAELQVGALLGINLYDGPWVRIAPMAGIGYNTLGFLEDDDEDSVSFLKGMRIMGGLDFDLKVDRTAYLYPNDRSISENCLNIRVYAAKTGFNAGLDGISINVGIAYACQMWGLKSW
jgi:hypothetical protein